MQATEAAIPARTGQHEEALRLFAECNYREGARLLADALKTRETSELWNDWATAQLMLGDTVDAEEGYRRALELDPQNACAAANLGIHLASGGRIPEAVPLLERAASGSTGAERQHLLRLARAYRAQPLAPPATNPNQNSNRDKQLMLQMARVIHQQSQAIARLTERVCAVEAAVARLATRPLQGETIQHPVGQGTTAKLPVGRFISPPKEDDAQAAASAASTAPNKAAGAAQQQSAQPGIYFAGVVYGGSGYAEEGWAVALGLAESGIPVQLVPVDQRKDLHSVIPEVSRKRLESLERQFVDIPRSLIFHSSPAPWWRLDWVGRHSIGRTMFETDRLPDVYRDACRAMDEVWVPSQFNLEMFTKAGVDKRKLRLVPGGVDTDVFHPGAAPLEIAKKRKFNFLSVFDWHRRKGYDALLAAYLREFTPDEDVALILKVYQLGGDFSDLEAQIGYFIERTAGVPMEKAPAIVLLNGFIPQSHMPRLYDAADAFVLPSRGEAYGRPYLEAMACQLPVIATNWGGQLDFLNHRNGYLIHSRLMPVPPDVEIEYYRGHCWAQPDVDHLRQLMREVYSHPEEARKKAQQGREYVVRNYDWSVIIPRWVREFQRLL